MFYKIYQHFLIGLLIYNFFCHLLEILNDFKLHLLANRGGTGYTYFNRHLKVLYLCGFRGDPTFLSYILPEIIVLNTCAKFEVKISVQNKWQHLTLNVFRILLEGMPKL